MATLRTPEKHEHQCLDVFAKTSGVDLSRLDQEYYSDPPGGVKTY